jgi:outer membrane protein TolC
LTPGANGGVVPRVVACPLAPALLASLAMSSPAALSLPEALSAAAAGSEVAGIAAARLVRAEAARREALSALFPTLGASGTYTRRAFEVTRQVGGQEVVLQRHDALAADVTLQASLLDARAWAGLDAARHGANAEVLDARELERRLAFEVARSFFAVLSAERLSGAAGERLRAAVEAARHARSRVDAGLAPGNEATRTALEEATARLTLEDAGLATTRARLSLSHLLGVDVTGRPLIEPADAPLPARTAEALEAEALAARADVAALHERAERARAIASEPALRLLPTLGLRGLFRVFNEAGFVGRNVDGNLALTLSWALFDGGARYARAELEAANVREAELLEQAARRRVGLELRIALADLAGADAALTQARLRLEVATTHAAEVRTLAARGLASALEQVDASVSAFEAGAELARQEVRRRVAELALL